MTIKKTTIFHRLSIYLIIFASIYYSVKAVNGTDSEAFKTLGGVVGLQILARADIPEGKALALDILDVPYSTLGEVLSILSVHSADEAAIAIHVLRVQEAEVASEHIIVALGSDETKAEATTRFRQFEEIAGIELGKGL